MSQYILNYHKDNGDELKQFIHSFNFPDPSWDNVPSNFPSVSKQDLSKAEKGMLTAIMLAWYIERGRNIVYKRFIKLGFTITFLIITGLYLKFVTSTPAFIVVKEISAATVSAGIKKLTVQRSDNFGEILESTMSATLSGNAKQ